MCIRDSKGPDGGVDPNTSIVPDKYDPLYARCGATAALDTMLVGYGSTFKLLGGVAAKVKDSDKALGIAHKCIIEGARGDIRIPAKDDEFDTEGPAPASRLALYQMLARFEKFDVDTAALSGDKRTVEDDAIEEQEKLLKQLKAQAEAQQLAQKDHTYSTQAEVAKDEEELQGLMAALQDKQAVGEQRMAKLVAGRWLNIAGHQFSKKRFSVGTGTGAEATLEPPDEVKCSGQPLPLQDG